MINTIISSIIFLCALYMLHTALSAHSLRSLHTALGTQLFAHSLLHTAIL